MSTTIVILNLTIFISTNFINLPTNHFIIRVVCFNVFIGVKVSKALRDIADYGVAAPLKS